MSSLSAGALASYRHLARERHARYQDTLGARPYRLLEIGCGAAGLAEEFERLGVDYHGLDLDPRPIRAARARGVSAIDVGDFTTMQRPAEPYDVICASQVLEHITTPVAFIERVHAWLAPGGIVHLDMPNHWSLSGVLAMGPRLGRPGRFGGIDYPHHAFSYEARTLRALLEGRFHARVFTVSPDDPVWGQVRRSERLDVPTRAYYAASRLLRLRSVLVAYGVRA